MNDAMTKQVGGTHYKGMKIEPFEFGHANRYDPETFSIMKYVSRHRAKNGAEDLNKGLHIVDIRLAQISRWGTPAIARDSIPVDTFIRENGIPEAEASILRKLHFWAITPRPKKPLWVFDREYWAALFRQERNHFHMVQADQIKAELRQLIQTYEET